MQVTTVSDFRDNIKKFMDDCWDNAEAIIIARPKGRNVVMLSAEDYERMRREIKATMSQERAQAYDLSR